MLLINYLLLKVFIPSSNGKTEEVISPMWHLNVNLKINIFTLIRRKMSLSKTREKLLLRRHCLLTQRNVIECAYCNLGIWWGDPCLFFRKRDFFLKDNMELTAKDAQLLLKLFVYINKLYYAWGMQLFIKNKLFLYFYSYGRPRNLFINICRKINVCRRCLGYVTC